MTDHQSKLRQKQNQKFLRHIQTTQPKKPYFFASVWKLNRVFTEFKNDTILCCDFNIDTIKDPKDKFHFEKSCLAFDFKKQNFEPTRVTPTSATCLDHILTNYQVNTEAIKRTISDHYTLFGIIYGVIINESPCKEMERRCPDLRNIKGENALNFLFSWIKYSKNMNLYRKLTLKK